MSANERTGGQILIDQLRLHGVELIFGVPGESYLPALDALYDVPEIDHEVAKEASVDRFWPSANQRDMLVYSGR